MLNIFDPKLSDLNQIQSDFVIAIWNRFQKAAEEKLWKMKKKNFPKYKVH